MISRTLVIACLVALREEQMEQVKHLLTENKEESVPTLDQLCATMGHKPEAIPHWESLADKPTRSAR